MSKSKLMSKTEVECQLIGHLMCTGKRPSTESLVPMSALRFKQHAWIVMALKEAERRGLQTDAVTISELLDEYGMLGRAGGYGYLLELVTEVDPTLSVEELSAAFAPKKAVH